MNHLTHFLHVTVTFLYLGISQPGFFNIIESDKHLIKTSKSEIGSSLTSVAACEIADICSDITSAQTLQTAPTDVNCGEFTTSTINGCLEGATPENSFTDCGFSDHPTVWFKIETDTNASQLYTFVSTEGSWQPVWAVYTGDCDQLSLLNGGSPANPSPCSNGDSNPDAHNNSVPGSLSGTSIKTFYVAVSGMGTIDISDFTLSAFTQAACVSCIGNDDCSREATFEITERSSGRSLNDTQFCQGEEVQVCIEFFYDASETGIDWFHGFIPDFGKGWDMSYFNPADAVITPQGAEWSVQDAGNCAPSVNKQMPLLCSYTDEDGILRLCNMKCSTCPCTPPLAQGSPLPSGWFWSSPGGEGCSNTCSPSSGYGLPGSNTGITIKICMDLKTRIFNDNESCENKKDLRISFTSTSDGVSGCWNDPIAECRLDIAQIGPDWELDCAALPVQIAVFEDDTIISGQEIDRNITFTDSLAIIIVKPVPNVSVQGLKSYTLEYPGGTITDILYNMSSTEQIAQYEITTLNGVCQSLPDTLSVLVQMPQCNPDKNYTQWPDCVTASQNKVICSLADLDQLCGEMFKENTPGAKPNPLCPDGGAAHNMSWFAFVAASGNYEIVVTPQNCTPGNGGQVGIQAGIYKDCTFTQPVFCQSSCETSIITIPSTSLIPGELYYFFMDGCSGSYCEYEIDVTGTYSTTNTPCDDNDPNTINDVYNEDCICKGELINTTGNEKIDEIKIFPNPTNENVFVLHTGIAGDMDISIFNSVGEKITIQKTKVENGYELHTSGLSSGVYFVKVQKDQTQNTYRMVKY
ncbi:MAG: T9SS type A sorting domain-containing protein [Saprospiraceae bacterium]|nr:T9SS type A sorting domain-containing protein [Saprospiraceae bacterium]